MLINATKSRLVIGRFSVLPGEKVPAFQLTGDEAAAVEKFKNSGRLVEKPGAGEPALPQPEPASACDAAPDAQQAEKTTAKNTSRASRRQEAKTVSTPESEDAAGSGEASTEQVSGPEGE